MSGRLSPYAEYRDSGVDWIGPVPKTWTVLATARISDLTTGERDTQDAVEDGQYPFFVRSQTVERINSYSFDGEGVLTSGDGAGVGKIFHHALGKFEFHQRVYLFHNFRRILGRYFFYFFREHLHLVALAGNAKSTVDSLRRPMLRMFPVCLPPKEEQTRIVDFLDYETAKIDALIEKQQQLIALLKEKRQAVISHAVTKGLDPSAPMKDSGVEWLGKVPAHWRTGKLKFFAELRSGHTPSRSKPEYWEHCYIPWFSLADVWQLREGQQIYLGDTHEKISDLGLANSAADLLPPGTVILSRTASVGFSGIMPRPMATTQDFVNWIPGPQLQSEFLLFTFRGMASEFDRLKVGSTHKTIYMPDVRQFCCAIPPIGEQVRIVEHLKALLAKLDSATSNARDAVTLLQERRTALISAAVTGKIDVRAWKPPAAHEEQLA